ncbi:MAG: alpha/beta hydrolase [Myxococcaceae bacterium]|nr:alpha/beta hydrolase [Myxococcaceae bacterium]
MLLVHGLPTASWDYARVWPSLSQRFAQVLAPDMIGFGWSDKPVDYPYSIADQADLHEALLRARGVTRYRMLAHDYGVTVAQELLARHDERRQRGDHSLVLERLCFLNGSLFPETHRPLLIQRLMLTRLGPLLSRALTLRSFGSSFRKVFGANTQPSAQELAEFFRLVTAGGGRRMFYRLFHYIPERRARRERWVSALQQTAVPLRFVGGAADPVSGAHVVTRYRELVARPDTVLLAGIGHYPHVEAPDAVLRAAEELLVG